jgi:hypothetical protein
MYKHDQYNKKLHTRVNEREKLTTEMAFVQHNIRILKCNTTHKTYFTYKQYTQYEIGWLFHNFTCKHYTVVCIYTRKYDNRELQTANKILTQTPT